MHDRWTPASAPRRRTRPLSACLAVVAAAALAPAPASAQAGFDLDLVLVQVNQAVQNGSTPIVAGRPTMVRVGAIASGQIPPGATYDGLLRIFVDGVELPESPIFSSNGPIPAKSNPGLANLDDTLNFVFLPPEDTGIVVTAEINLPGPNQLAETDFSNNVASSPSFSATCRRHPEVVYVPVDYRPGGGPTPNLPDPLLIEPGVGDNFVQGIYPSPDWEYHRSDAPSKLWTSSIQSTASALLSSLATDLQMMNPQPDFIYGWINGGLPYNGQAIGIPGTAGVGNTEPVRHQRTFAHELGHLFGLSHNNTKVNTFGIDVEHHLAITEMLPVVKPPDLNDIMSPGLLTFQAWVFPGNYLFFANHSIFQCPSSLPQVVAQETMLLAGRWNTVTDAVELDQAITFVGGRPTPTVPLDEADLVLRVASDDAVIAELGLPVNTSTDCAGDSEGDVAPIASFVHVLPTSIDLAAVQRLAIVDPESGAELAAIDRSPSSPELDLVTPDAGGIVADGLLVEWQASDADGDALRYYLRYSPDGDRMVPLASNQRDTGVFVDFSALPEVQAGARLELFATDGLNTTKVEQPLFSVAEGGGNAPWVQVLSPDDGTSYPKAGTVVLHSSGWDLEDRALTGSSIVWSSNVDGVIGTGRVIATADLSVGTHVITVTATDSSLASSTDVATIDVIDRPLPMGEVCQTDIGFGGPGTAVLEMCGGDLSAGTTADVLLTGAPPSALTFLAVSASNNPTPLFGGTIVPFPPDVVVASMADAAGSWTLPGIQGGGGPATTYIQGVYEDAAQPEGFGVTNAVQVDFLP